ncbi:MAG: ABC transporter substrate-binding protein, partial [Clostridia bacterium]|nr:ABC transporter substrate-binding protein [Clostridia bacterium]
MKKIFSIFLLAIMVISTCIITTGCSNEKNSKQVIRVNQVTNSIFYAPLYVAINNGYFEDEGYTVELTTAEGSNTTNVALMTNSADIGLMGPEQNVYSYVNGDTNYPVAFGQLTKRDGSFLISRTNETGFDWSNLAGKHIIAGRKGGSPAMSLQMALENNGYDITTELTFDTSIAFANIAGSFLSGVGDYMTLFEPAASEFVKTGNGYIVASVGEESGEIPFTCFSANKDYIQKNPQVIIAFLKAIQRGLNYVQTANIDDVVSSLLPS